MSHALFIEAVSHLRRGFQQELERAAALPISSKEKTPLAKTVRTCRQILKVEPALWTFVHHPSLEPTNNAAEQALRPAVIWRRLSFGSKSQGGSEFVARMPWWCRKIIEVSKPYPDWIFCNEKGIRGT